MRHRRKQTRSGAQADSHAQRRREVSDRRRMRVLRDFRPRQRNRSRGMLPRAVPRGETAEVAGRETAQAQFGVSSETSAQ